MGSSPTGILAYGYALGGADGWDINEVDEYGGPDPTKVTWYDEDNGTSPNRPKSSSSPHQDSPRPTGR